MNIKWLAICAGVLLVLAVILSFTGYPKLITRTQDLTLSAQNKEISIGLKKITYQTEHHLLKNSSTYNLIFDTRIQAQADRRLENINFYINCFNDQNQLINCTNAKEIEMDEKLSFSRDWSLITKIPLDVTLLKQSQDLAYSPQFFGVNFGVKKAIFIYTDKPYSRTDLQDTTTSDLALPVEIQW